MDSRARLPFAKVDCVGDEPAFDLIMMECSSQFDDINFNFGGKDFALTVSELCA